EDGIRDGHVTGVQTCALPIYSAAIEAALGQACKEGDRPTLVCCKTVIGHGSPHKADTHEVHGAAEFERRVCRRELPAHWQDSVRSEERRVGKERMSRWAPVQR